MNLLNPILVFHAAQGLLPYRGLGMDELEISAYWEVLE